MAGQDIIGYSMDVNKASFPCWKCKQGLILPVLKFWPSTDIGTISEIQQTATEALSISYAGTQSSLESRFVKREGRETAADIV